MGDWEGDDLVVDWEGGDLVGIEFIRVNKMDGIEFVEIDDEDNGMEGYVLVNKIDVIDDGKAVQIYGTVVIGNGCNEIVYDRSWNNPERKSPGEYLSLTGPSIGVNADHFFGIRVMLWFHDDDGIVKGEIEEDRFWFRQFKKFTLNQLLQCEITGKYGSVTVGYSVIGDASNNTIDVVMINDHGESPVAIYGAIEATTTFYNESSITRMLFDKSENECVQVSSQHSIPCNHPEFLLAPHSNLTIVVHLWSHGDQIAQGSVQFTRGCPTQKKNIRGKYGELQVSFTHHCD